MNGIKSLQRCVRDSLRSSVTLFDLSRVVEELTYNSVDFGATKVYVSINVRACYVKVEDDGCGITRDDLVILGERYATSKSHLLTDKETNSGSLGFRGEALASLSDVSLLEIRTKARGMPNAYCKIIKGSKCLFLGIDDQREAVGTTVVVRELFYNQPVRRNYMQLSPKKVLHSIKKCVLRIALVYPLVLFKVTDIASEDELLCTIPSSSPLSLISDGFGNEVSSSLQEIVFSDKILMLSGYISGLQIDFSTKAFQYIYINSRFVCKGPIHNLLNNLAARFQCFLTQGKVKPEFQRWKRRKTQGYPAFLLNLCCPLSGYDLHFEPSKTVVEFKDWSTILAFFEKSVRNFWEPLAEKSLQENNHASDDSLPIESAIQEEGLSMRSKMREVEFDMLLHQNTRTHTSVTSPLDVSLRDGEVDRKQDMSLEGVHIFSWLKPCQGKVGYLGQDCCPEHSMHNSLDTFASSPVLSSYVNSSQQWPADIGSLLENDLLPDGTPRSDGENGILDREWRSNIPKDFGSLKKGASHCLISCGPFDIVHNGEKRQFSLPCFSAHGKLEREWSDSFGCGNGYSASYTNPSRFADEVDHLGNYSPFHDSANAAEADNMSSVRHTCFHEKDDIYRPSASVIKQFTANPELKLSSNGTKKSFSCEEASSYEKYELHDGLASDVLATDSICGFSEKDWYLGIPQSVSAKIPGNDTHGLSSKGHLPSGTSIPCKYAGIAEDAEILNSTQDSSNEVTPATFTKTELDFQFNFFPERNLQYGSSPPNQISCGKASSSVLFNDETGWSPIESSNVKNTEIYSKRAVQTSVQIQGKERQSLWDELDFQNSLSSEVHKERSRRSCSAPPFYKGKYRFFTLNDHLSMKNSTSNSFYVSNTAQEETNCPLNGLSQPPPSQPCLNTAINEVSESFPRKCGHEKICTPEMDGIQKIKEFNGVYYNQSSHNSSAGKELECALSTPTKWRMGTPLATVRDVSDVSKDDVLSISTGLLHLCASSLIPESINKDCLEHARVLLQLDRKFIPVIADETLVIIDQHAADERIRLEELREKVLSGEGVSVTYLDSEQELVLPEMGYQLLQKYEDQIQNWGWICNIHSQCSESFAKNVNLLKRRRCSVTLSAVPCILGINLNERDLIEFIEQLVETDGSSTMPPSVHRILNSKACRGAIMFGDSLLPSECSLIVEELKATSLCFQCAHGRPTAVPLVNVASLREQLAIFEMEKGSQEGEMWHGLRRHEPSIERARLRLETAKRFHGG